MNRVLNYPFCSPWPAIIVLMNSNPPCFLLSKIRGIVTVEIINDTRTEMNGPDARRFRHGFHPKPARNGPHYVNYLNVNELVQLRIVNRARTIDREHYDRTSSCARNTLPSTRVTQTRGNKRGTRERPGVSK